MKKWLYYFFNIVSICIIIYNVYFIRKNIFMVGKDIYYIENIQEDFTEMIIKALNDNVTQNIERITKAEVGDNFPTGVYNIKITYIDKDGLEKSTIINESIRNNEETLIVDYIKQKGIMNINLKIKYFIIVGLTCFFIILLIILNVKKNKSKYSDTYIV